MSGKEETGKPTSQDTSKLFHPKNNRDGMRTLRPTVYFHSIQDIDTQSETFDAVVTVHLAWLDCWPKRFLDPAAKDNKNTIEHESGFELQEQDFQNLVREKEMFDPRVEIRNLVSAKVEEGSLWYKIFPTKPWQHPDDPNFKIADREGCVVIRALRIAGKFKCFFELKKFPLDIQNLDVNITCFQKTERLDFVFDQVKYKSILDASNFFPKQEWNLEEGIRLVPLPATDPKVSMTGCSYPQMCARVRVSRKGSHFTLNVMVPLFLITFMSHFAGFIPQDSIGDKISVIYTMFLAAIAFKIVVAQELPKIGYLNFSDFLVNANLVWLLGLTIFELAAFKAELSQKTEEAVIWGMLGSWLLLSLVVCVCISEWDKKGSIRHHELVKRSSQASLQRGNDAKLRK